MIESRQRFVILPGIQVRISEIDVQKSIIGTKGDCFLNLGHGFFVLMGFRVGSTECGMSIETQGVDLDCFLIRRYSLVILAVGGISPSETVERVFVVWIHLCLLAESIDRVARISQ